MNDFEKRKNNNNKNHEKTATTKLVSLLSFQHFCAGFFSRIPFRKNDCRFAFCGCQVIATQN